MIECERRGKTVEDPLDRYYRRSDDRIEATLISLRSMRGGGTVCDVRETMILQGHETPELRTVRRDLWLLERLGLAAYDETDFGRWWRSVKLVAE